MVLTKELELLTGFKVVKEKHGKRVFTEKVGLYLFEWNLPDIVEDHIYDVHLVKLKDTLIPVKDWYIAKPNNTAKSILLFLEAVDNIQIIGGAWSPLGFENYPSLQTKFLVVRPKHNYLYIKQGKKKVQLKNIYPKKIF